MNSERLKELQQKVAQKFSEISAAHPDQIACQKGCHLCCRPDLSVSRLEQLAIRDYINKNTEIRRKVEQLHKTKPWGKSRCEFLAEDGACSIYEVRPLICRSHGAPIKFRFGETLQRDVCKLNFTDMDLAGINEDLVINIELLNTILAMINQFECPDFKGRQRFPLNIQGIVYEEGSFELAEIVPE